MSGWRTVLIFIVLVMLNRFVELATAKCPSEIYEIKGVVLDTNSNPVNEASISIFFDDQESGFTGHVVIKGSFSVRCLYDTFKKSTIFGDKCKDTPSSLTVIVHARGYFTKKMNVKISRAKKTEKINMLEIPPVILVEIPPSAQELLKQESEKGF